MSPRFLTERRARSTETRTRQSWSVLSFLGELQAPGAPVVDVYLLAPDVLLHHLGVLHHVLADAHLFFGHGALLHHDLFFGEGDAYLLLAYLGLRRGALGDGDALYRDLLAAGGDLEPLAV